ncbi:MAG TPA: hypothetical protein VKP30_24685 [Polyangiaceae bacterium]|nr:hypothetical protein [Polyangiaceae bacterium]
MFWRSKEIGKHIAYVASSLKDPVEFSLRAQHSAEQLGKRAIGKSKAYFWTPPEKPSSHAGEYEGLGEWMSMCQAAIFEIWFHLGSVALPELRKVAFGSYDWTQAYATNALCRLATQGLDTEKTAAGIAKALPRWRYEQVMRVCGRVAELAARSEVLLEAYDRLIEVYKATDPVDALELVSALAEHCPNHVRELHSALVRDLSEGLGLEHRTPFDDGHVVPTPDGRGFVAKGGPTYPLVPDYHRIRATMVLHKLEPNNQHLARRLQAWSTNHPDALIRKELTALLARASLHRA